MGHPEQGLRGALIAGTNGKGSTAAMLASILQAGGSRTGLMPKPHLVSYRERIQLAGVPISEADFAAAVTALRPQLEEVRAALGQPTEFEILTAVAISYLAQRVDRLVCEVGMGGRLDATNVLDWGSPSSPTSATTIPSTWAARWRRSRPRRPPSSSRGTMR
jgi:dihydrofolate synthase/folylpolyglutamate synthase